MEKTGLRIIRVEIFLDTEAWHRSTLLVKARVTFGNGDGTEDQQIMWTAGNGCNYVPRGFIYGLKQVADFNARLDELQKIALHQTEKLIAVLNGMGFTDMDCDEECDNIVGCVKELFQKLELTGISLGG